ncbi:hypothetical protein ACIPYQ_37985 [Streptomyces sp. NPDC090045]|uniref:hypothetical protein n=1 Tax=Streptomyces sp. NPDC090045 TaxID=3365927 RepID=UPI0038218928
MALQGSTGRPVLAILWQEQQWYQNVSPGLTWPLAQAGNGSSAALTPKPSRVPTGF